MTAVQAITGRGGWPLNVFLTPDRKPFYGGTYFPARDGDRGASVGFFYASKAYKETYQERSEMVVQSSHKLTMIIRENLNLEPGKVLPESNLLHQAVSDYKQAFDAKDGGLRGDTKFPGSLPVGLLLRYYHRTNDAEALRMEIHTLEKMASGGIFDHVDGGFHRYATDKKWLSHGLCM